MPAMRTARRDVILRVPKISARSASSSSSSRPSTSAQNHDANEPALSNRRSMSPAKRGAGGLTGGGNKEAAAATSRTEPEDVNDGESYQYASQATSAAEWNSLLIWARRQRGPQWDAATGIWQVDRDSAEYYSFGNDPARGTKLSTTTPTGDDASAQLDAKAPGERRNSTMEEGEDEHHNLSGYSVEDSPPIGPGGRRSRAR